MEMYFKQDSRSFGPELCYEFPFVGEHAFGYLTGYIKTIGVETDGEISIKNFETPGVMDNYVFEYSGQLFSEVEGTLSLEAVYLGQNPSKIKFKVSIYGVGINVFSLCKDVRVKGSEDFILFY